MEIFYIVVLAVFGLWVVYKLGVMVYHAIKMGLDQAKFLEDQFGTDIAGAAKFSLGLAPKKDGGNDAA